MRQPSIKTARDLLTVIVYASLPLVIVFLVVRDINPSGTRTIEYAIGRPSPVISQLFPEQRLKGIFDGEQAVRLEPIYFTVRYPHRYETADVWIDVHNSMGLVWKVGAQTGPDSAWSYDLKQPDADGRLRLDLSSAYVQNRQLRFIVSVQGLLPDSTFAIKNIQVNFRRKPLFNWL